MTKKSWNDPRGRAWTAGAALAILWGLTAGGAVAAQEPERPDDAAVPQVGPEAAGSSTAAPAESGSAAEAPEPPGGDVIELRVVPHPDLETLEPAVARQLETLQGLLDGLLAESPPPLAELAEAFGELGRHYQAYNLQDAAEVCYVNANRLAPGEARWLYYLAYLRQQGGRLDEAADGYARTLSLEPSNLTALTHLGEVYLAQNRLGEARFVLEQAIQRAPSPAPIAAALGQVALEEGRYQEAVHYLEGALEAVPAANRLHYPLGLAYRGLGMMDKAREHLAQRGEVGVRIPDPLIDELAQLKTGERVYLLQGQTAYRAGRYEEAVAAFRKAVEAQPDSARARINLGSTLGLLGQVEEAKAQYREALRLAPDSATAHFNLGLLLVREGDLEEAVEHFDQAVVEAQDDHAAHLELARTLRRLGRGEEALPHYTAAARLDRFDENTWLEGAGTLVDMGRYGQAREVLESGLAALPDSGRISRALAQVLAAAPDASVRDGDRALELARRVFEARRTLDHAALVAEALAELDRCQEAADWLEAAISSAEEGGQDVPLADPARAALARYETQQPCRIPPATQPR